MAQLNIKGNPDSEKKLQTIKLSLYGKEINHTFPTNNKNFSSKEPLREVNYLRSDLLKTLMIACILIISQILIHLKLDKFL